MTRRERIQAALVGEPVDRMPYVFWRRFPAVDRSPAGLAQATLRFHDRYGSDLLVLVPSDGAAVAAWGCEEADTPADDGARPCARCAVRDAADWPRIGALDPATAPGYAETLEAIVRLGFDRRIGDAPVLLALPSVHSVARRLSSDRVGEDLAADPAVGVDALAAIAETLARFVELVLGEGLGGVLYTIDAPRRAARDAETPAGAVLATHDRRVLDTVRRRGGLALVHATGPPAILERVAALPVDAVSWTGGTTAAALGAMRGHLSGLLLGGIDRRTLREGTPAAAAAEVHASIDATEGQRLVIAPGGPLLLGTPDAPVAAVVEALGGRLRPLPGVAL